jgi:hypothetical protein
MLGLHTQQRAHNIKSRSMHIRAGIAVLACLFTVTGLTIDAQAEPAQGYVPIVAAVHVHSTASTGTLSLDALATRAEQLGIDAVLLTENLSLRYEYGLYPLESFMRVSRSFHSLMDYGVSRYLNDVAEAQARHPRVILIPGLEVAPYYYWSGSLWSRDLTMHAAQKNLLVFGLTSAEQIATLPAAGNISSYSYGPQTLSLFLPMLLAAPVLWAWRAKSDAVGQAHSRISRKKRIAGFGLVTIAGVLTLNAWPIGEPPFNPYDTTLRYRPYQAFIDSVTRSGGSTLWSMTEARDFQTVELGPFGTATISTDPHPEALLLTTGYAGFGGLYQEARQATQPNRIWDQLIKLYASGERDDRPAMVGEIAFHSPDHAGKELDQVLTIFWVQERSQAGILDAIRQGRAYAVERYKKEFRLTLDDFHAATGDGGRRVGPGEALSIAQDSPISLHVSVSTTDNQGHPVTVRLIKSGEVMAHTTGVTPLHYDVLDPHGSSGMGETYRLEVRGGQTGELLTNPIYIDSHGQGAAS